MLSHLRVSFSQLPDGFLLPAIMLPQRLLRPVTGAITTACCAAALVLARSATASGTSPADQFEMTVRPILANNCYSCHGPQTQSGGLRFDQKASLFGHTASGKTVVSPDHPEASALIAAVQYGGAVKMPPTGKLPQKAIDTLVAWVRAGAPYPAETKRSAPAAWQRHWAFLPVRKPAIPRVRSAAWVRTPIDAFVLACLEAHHLTPAAPADRRTLIRRVTYDLTGLPPTPAEVDAFARDRQPHAYRRLVDRLLASPHYGERWGRYWLDIARYADTKGYVFNEDRVYHWAYTYRDWVIHAFNADMPYNQFLIDQIAADEIPNAPRADLAALGFVTLGRRFLEQQPDIIDDRIDVLCRGTMALTVECARCHDHKFDPIPTADYYSLYAVFASSQEPKEEPIIDTPAKAAAWQAFQADLAVRQKAIDAYQTANKVELAAKQPAAEARLQTLQAAVKQCQAGAPPEPARAMALEDAPHPVDGHIFIRGNPNRPGDAVSRRFLALLSGPDRQPFQHGSGRLELAQDIASPTNPLTARVLVNRVWLHHFGQAIVPTTSDFGMRSDPPSNPKLLDYLAWRFVHDGWSIKKLQRLILLSSVYRESSEDVPKDRARDPENRLCWRMNRQRLDFEAMRDSLLAAGGDLDLTMGGPSVDLEATPFTTRRTVYGYVDRQNLPALFRTFDYATPDATSSERHVTTVPQQALFLMNSPFVVEQARKLAARAAAASTPAARVQQLYRIVFQRAAAPDEVAMALRFIRQSQQDPAPQLTANGPKPLQPWEEYAQALLMTNEFMYID